MVQGQEKAQLRTETRKLKPLAETLGHPEKIAHSAKIVLGRHQIMPFQQTGAQAQIDGKDCFLWAAAAGKFVGVIVETLSFAAAAAVEIQLAETLNRMKMADEQVAVEAGNCQTHWAVVVRPFVEVQ